MRVLGIEGTAWAASAAIYGPEDRVTAMESAVYQPDSGGIHPREAAEHMANAIPEVIETVLAETGPIDAVAFSRGPGLGPCLRVVATAARTVAQVRDVPLVGVNHMVAHLEVGRSGAGFADPVCLNASGANAHVLGYQAGRYRVLGETMDTGVGNAIDKFTRHVGWSHPGGPKVEAHAVDGGYLDLPYVVKGMDFSFSGIMSAAKAAYDDGEAIEDICFSLQETIFAMLTEVSERALSLTGRDELVLGGGVGQNDRLQEMLSEMCADRGATLYAPEARFLRDNAGMIALLGARMFEADDTIPVEDSKILAEFRPDDVPVTWREEVPKHRADRSAVDRGAEATVTFDDTRVEKTRHPKGYRHPALDERLRAERTAAEARLTSVARRMGVPTPVIKDIDPSSGRLVTEHVGTADLRDVPTADRLWSMGHHLATLHGNGIVHGDPTVRNARVAPAEPAIKNKEGGRVYLIDFGLGYHSDHVEDFAMDLHVLGQSLEATSPEASTLRSASLDGYHEGADDAATVIAQVRDIADRGRYQ